MAFPGGTDQGGNLFFFTIDDIRLTEVTCIGHCHGQFPTKFFRKSLNGRDKLLLVIDMEVAVRANDQHNIVHCRLRFEALIEPSAGFHDPGLGIGKVVLVFFSGLIGGSLRFFSLSFLLSPGTLSFFAHTSLFLFHSVPRPFVQSPVWLPEFWLTGLFFV